MTGSRMWRGDPRGTTALDYNTTLPPNSFEQQHRQHVKIKQQRVLHSVRQASNTPKHIIYHNLVRAGVITGTPSVRRHTATIHFAERCSPICSHERPPEGTFES